MNPAYLWLTSAILLLTFFIVGPVIATAIAYTAWRGKAPSFSTEQYGMAFVVSGVTDCVLFVFAKWLNADVRTPQYLLQLASFLLSGLFFGVFMGCGLSVLLRLWRWHHATRLTDDSQAK